MTMHTVKEGIGNRERHEFCDLELRMFLSDT
jgi:hypothetical protein